MTDVRTPEDREGAIVRKYGAETRRVKPAPPRGPPPTPGAGQKLRRLPVVRCGAVARTDPVVAPAAARRHNEQIGPDLSETTHPPVAA